MTADPGPSVKVGTEYVLLAEGWAASLEQDEPKETVWRKVATISARSAEHAIRQYAEKNGQAATLVAVPARSWQPVKVQVKTETRIEIGSAS